MTSLVKQVEAKLAKSGDVKGFLVLLTEDSDTAEEQLKKFAKDNGIEKMPLTLMEGAAGPKKYNIAQDAEVTVHLWKGKKKEVLANFAFAKGELDENSISQIVGKIPSVFEN